MAIGMLQSWEGFTKEMYEGVTEKMFGHSAPMRAEESPEGLIVHSAGQTPNGWYVYDIWESREAFERFMDEQLMPAARELMGDQPPPAGAEPQFFPVDVLVMPQTSTA
jgi:quinol monooxygenase YgiN